MGRMKELAMAEQARIELVPLYDNARWEWLESEYYQRQTMLEEVRLEEESVQRYEEQQFINEFIKSEASEITITPQVTLNTKEICVE